MWLTVSILPGRLEGSCSPASGQRQEAETLAFTRSSVAPPPPCFHLNVEKRHSQWPKSPASLSWVSSKAGGQSQLTPSSVTRKPRGFTQFLLRSPAILQGAVSKGCVTPPHTPTGDSSVTSEHTVPAGLTMRVAGLERTLLSPSLGHSLKSLVLPHMHGKLVGLKGARMPAQGRASADHTHASCSQLTQRVCIQPGEQAGTAGHCQDAWMGLKTPTWRSGNYQPNSLLDKYRQGPGSLLPPTHTTGAKCFHDGS